MIVTMMRADQLAEVANQIDVRSLWPKWEPSRSLGGREFDLRRVIRYALA